tara:strand:+ start:1077 stop:2900 length:1824 start_codon:yes stop_codon:yes gene_type:complete
MYRTNKIIFSFCALWLSLYAYSDISLDPADREALLKQLPADQREAMRAKMEDSTDLKQQIEEAFEEESIVTERPERKDYSEEEGYCKDCIYGYDLFRYSPSTFAPSNKVPVPSSYALGPGDKIKISYFGNKSVQKEKYVSRDGQLELPELGPVSVVGLSFNEAKELIENKVETELQGVNVSLTLTELRSINIYVLGEAYKPGAYTLSSLSTVTNALFVSGGVNEKGSLRNIQIKRQGKEIKSYDLYDLLLYGDSSSDIRLQDGDAIFIPFIDNTFEAVGAFKRPYLYEFLEGETIADAIMMAGGFLTEVTKEPIIELNTVNTNKSNREILSFSFSNENLARKILDGDVVSVGKVKALEYEYVKLSGEVKNPGTYSIKPGDTLLDLIQRAGGYTNSAYPLGAVFTREDVAKQQKEGFERNADALERFIINAFVGGSIEAAAGGITEFTFSPVTMLINRLRSIEPIGRQTIEADLLTLKTKPYSNIKLAGGDALYVPKRPDSINVVGEVLNASTLRFDPNFSFDDYIDMTGGLTSYADSSNIIIVRPDGKAVPYEKKIFRKHFDIVPGSTIVVSRKIRSLDGVSLARIITPILADLATSAAAIAVLSDD